MEMAWKWIYLIIFQMTLQPHGNFPGATPPTIHGTVGELEIVQDDISFYTWSVYLDVRVAPDWAASISPEVLQDPRLKERINDFPEGTLKFMVQGIDTETGAKAFVGDLGPGDSLAIATSAEGWKQFLQGQTFAIPMEKVEAVLD